MIEKKEDTVRKTPLSQVLISTRIRNLEEDHRVLISIQLRDQLRQPVARLFYRHHQLLVHHECNTPKYALVVFDIFREFCKHNLNFS